jgi:hypothetical protein
METETQYYASRRSQNPVTLGFAMPSMPPEEAPITCSFTNHSLSDALRWSQMSDKKRTLFESLYAENDHFTKTGSGQTYGKLKYLRRVRVRLIQTTTGTERQGDRVINLM